MAAVEDGLDWIDASGSATGRDSTRNDPPSICVPKDVPPGCVYGYDVKVNGVGILDPRVRVVRH